MKNLLTNRYLNRWLVLLIDVCVSMVSAILTLAFVRYFGGEVPMSNAMFAALILGSVVVSALCFMAFRTHHNIIRHSSLKSMWVIGAAVIVKGLIFYVMLSALVPIELSTKRILLGVMLDML